MFVANTVSALHIARMAASGSAIPAKPWPPDFFEPPYYRELFLGPQWELGAHIRRFQGLGNCLGSLGTDFENFDFFIEKKIGRKKISKISKICQLLNKIILGYV